MKKDLSRAVFTKLWFFEEQVFLKLQVLYNKFLITIQKDGDLVQKGDAFEISTAFAFSLFVVEMLLEINLFLPKLPHVYPLGYFT